MVKNELSERKQAKLERAARKAAAQQTGEPIPNPVWFKPIMFGFMLLGLLWIITYYITSATISLPIPALGQGNIFVGFGLIMVGFMMTTRWR